MGLNIANTDEIKDRTLSINICECHCSLTVTAFGLQHVMQTQHAVCEMCDADCSPTDPLQMLNKQINDGASSAAMAYAICEHESIHIFKGDPQPAIARGWYALERPRRETN